MWTKIKKFVKHSETIAWAWIQTGMGSIISILAFVDPTLVEGLLTPKAFAIYVLLNGLATKYLRERRDEELKKRGE